MSSTLAYMAWAAGALASISHGAEPGAAPNGPSTSEARPPAKLVAAAPQSADPVVTAQLDITFDALRRLSANPGNVVCSPLSLITGLAMAQVGAGGATRSELTTLLRWTGKSEDLSVAFAAVSRKVDAAGSLRPRRKGAPVEPQFVWSSLNRVWVDFNLPLDPQFHLALQRQFAAAVVSTDFKDTDLTSKDINGWVNQQTRGLIPKIVEPAGISAGGVTMINACYFKGEWVWPFEHSSTGPETFTLADGTKVQTPMMRQTRSLAYGRGAGWQSVALPYKGSVEAVLILPDTGQMNTVVGSLKSESFATMRSAMKATPVRLAVPTFEVQMLTSVKGLLQSLGVRLAFESSADFSGISASPTYIGDVIHGAKLRFDEAGTEAAAATAVMTKDIAMPPKPDQVELTIDRPFVLLVRETSTGAMLFAVKIDDPRAQP